METWIPVKGYENLYKISDTGKIISYHHRVEKQIGYNIHSKTGYCSVTLVKDGVKKTWLLHRLVLINFTGKEPVKMDVNHLNSIRIDNRLENLEWCTRKENIQHAWKMGRGISNLIGVRREGGRSVLKICLITGNVIKEYMMIKDALVDGYKASTLSMCLKGINKTAYGYKWEYKYKHNKKYD